jgi:hypothetical protein
MMLAGLPVPNDAVAELATIVRGAGADELADRLERALTDEVKLLALTLDERALMLNALDEPPQELAELRAVLLADHQWRRGEGARLKSGRRLLPRRPAIFWDRQRDCVEDSPCISSGQRDRNVRIRSRSVALRLPEPMLAAPSRRAAACE